MAINVQVNGKWYTTDSIAEAKEMQRTGRIAKKDVQLKAADIIAQRAANLAALQLPPMTLPTAQELRDFSKDVEQAQKPIYKGTLAETMLFCPLCECWWKPARPCGCSAAVRCEQWAMYMG